MLSDDETDTIARVVVVRELGRGDQLYETQVKQAYAYPLTGRKPNASRTMMVLHRSGIAGKRCA